MTKTILTVFLWDTVQFTSANLVTFHPSARLYLQPLPYPFQSCYWSFAITTVRYQPNSKHVSALIPANFDLVAL